MEKQLMTNEVTYNSRLQKGGALIAEMRALLRRWEPGADTREFVNTLIQENALGKASRSRMEDILRETFLPRYVRGNPPDAWKYLRPLEQAGCPAEHMKLLLYYHAARSEHVMYDFVVGPLYERYFSGALNVSVKDALDFIDEATADGKIPKPWSDSVSERVAQGILAALRDFGLLEGKVIKKIQRPALPIPCFAYVAFLIKQQVASGERILQHDDWRLFLLEPGDVERLFMEAHQQEYLSYHAMGNIIRIEFEPSTMEELVDAILARAT